MRISTDFNQGPQIKDFQLGSWVRIWRCEFLKFWYLNSTWVSQAPKFFPWDKILCLCMVAFNLLYANGWEVIAWLSSSFSPPWPLLFPESFDRSLVLAWKICIINEGFSTKRLQACWVCFYYTTWEQGVYWTKKKKMSILIFFLNAKASAYFGFSLNYDGPLAVKNFFLLLSKKVYMHFVPTDCVQIDCCNNNTGTSPNLWQKHAPKQ